MKRCSQCTTALDITGTVGRNDTCPRCGAYLRACCNCRFYDPVAYNQCHEPQAERVVDKERSNFCDYFSFRNTADITRAKESADDARSKLESLFKR